MSGPSMITVRRSGIRCAITTCYVARITPMPASRTIRATGGRRTGPGASSPTPTLTGPMSLGLQPASTKCSPSRSSMPTRPRQRIPLTPEWTCSTTPTPPSPECHNTIRITAITSSPSIAQAVASGLIENGGTQRRPELPGSGEEASGMRVCVPITDDGQVAVADVAGKEIRDWQEFTVAWGTLHDQGTEGAHHARVARFLRDNQVDAVAVCHVGSGMQRMLGSMAIRVVTGPGGDAHSAARAAG